MNATRAELLEDADYAVSLIEPLMGEEEADFVRETMERMIRELRNGGNDATTKADA